MKKQISQLIVMTLLATCIPISTFAQADKPEVITIEKLAPIGFWDSSWAHAGMSLVAPGSGQIYSGLTQNQDWFSLGRGGVYLALLALGYWQLFDSMNRKDTQGSTLWGGVLIGLNVVAPIDAFLATTIKQGATEQAYESGIKAIYENALNLAAKGEFQKAITTIQHLPTDSPLYQSGQEKIKEWTQAQIDQQAEQKLAEAEAAAKNGIYATAIELAQGVSPESQVYPQAQEKAKAWQKTLAERIAHRTLQQAYDLAAKGQFKDAIKTAGEISEDTDVYKKAQEKIQQWQKIMEKRK